MNSVKIIHEVKTNLHRNSSTILTCIGAIGVVGTAVLAVKATPKALDLIYDAEYEKGDKLTKIETIKVAGVVYIPSILIGASTIACIFGANVLNKRNQAALMSAYALMENSFKEYKNKVKELYGENTDIKVRNSIARDKLKDSDIFEESIDKLLFYDEFSGTFFESTMEKVVKTEYELNRRLALNGFVMLNEFYDILGLSPVENGDAFGWSLDIGDTRGYSWIDFEHIKVEAEDENDPDYCEFYRLVMKQEPTIDYDIILDNNKPTLWKNRRELRNEKRQNDVKS